MSRCPICDCKPMNCDCSEEARQLYYLRQEMEEREQEITMTTDQTKQAERREMFKSVAKICMQESLRAYHTNGGHNILREWISLAEESTEAILSAADKFAKDGGNE